MDYYGRQITGGDKATGSLEGQDVLQNGFVLSERHSFTALMSRSRQVGNHFLAFYDQGLFVVSLTL